MSAAMVLTNLCMCRDFHPSWKVLESPRKFSSFFETWKVLQMILVVESPGNLS